MTGFRERTAPLASPGPSLPAEALGQSDSFLDFQEQLARVAPVERPVILIGERGTGKELAAVRLHYLSKRWQEPFVALNCAALNPSLIEAELFGYEKGAFTGAVQRRSGRFEAADGGTLFLDEVGTIPLETQEKILRVVEYGSFERVGGTATITTDVRIVAATNADLPALAAEGRFKRDLLDRLSFEVLILPPLRTRHGDVCLLAEHFARRMALELEWEERPRFSEDALTALEAHPWPGNVRELKNVVERAVYRSASTVVDRIDFDPFHPSESDGQVESEADPPASPLQNQAAAHCIAGESAPEITTQLETLPLKEAVRQFEIDRIRRALLGAHYNRRRAARTLGLSYHQLRGYLKKYEDALK